MNIDDEDDVSTLWDAIKKTSQLPKSHAKLDALEALTRRVVQLNGHLIAFIGYFHTINACNGVDSPERMLAAYTGMRATYQKHGSEWEPSFTKYLLHAGSFVIRFVDSFPQIPRKQIDALYAEQVQMHEANGVGLQKLVEAEVWLELEAGNLDRARELYDRMLGMPVDLDGWCKPCVTNQRVSMLAWLDRDADAIEMAAPLVDGGRKCDTVPKVTWATLLLPLARTGDWERAREYHAKSHRASMEDPQIASAARVITFAAVDRSFTKGKNLLERCLPAAFEPKPKDWVRQFLVAAMVYFTAVGRERKTTTLALPKECPLHRADGRYEVEALRAYFHAEAEKLATAFDRRNGNSFHAKRLAAACDVLSLAPP
jgi:hypothetical protein